MSWDIYLMDKKGEVLTIDEPFEEGGTYQMGGTKECLLNVTWNYGCLFDFKKLNELPAQAGAKLMRQYLEGKPDEVFKGAFTAFLALYPDLESYFEDVIKDYWAPTPINVCNAIRRLLTFSDKHPEGVWEVHS